MFEAIKQRAADMRTIKTLCEQAERHANASGQHQPGAEHFILAALDLPDGTARQAFTLAGADPDRFREAISQQYGEALAYAGCAPAALDQLQDGVTPQAGLYQAGASGQALMQQLATFQKTHAKRALIGAHVLAVGAASEYGVTARALQRMGIEGGALVAAASSIA